MASPLQPVPGPLRVRRLSRNEAQAQSLLAQRAIDRTVRVGELEWTISLEPLAAPPAPGGADWKIDGSWAGVALSLVVPASAGAALVAAHFPDLDLPAIPDAFAAAALEEALGDIVNALGALGRGPARIERLDRNPAAGEPRMPAHCFTLTARRAGQEVCATLGTDSLGLMLMAGLLSQLPPAANGLDADSLPIVLRAELGRTSLPADALGRLASGDVIRVEHAWISQGGELWLGQESFGVRVRWDDTQLIITQAFGKVPLIMTSPDSSLADGGAPVALERIPVQITFDLGERQLTLAELKTLQPGQVLDLGRPLTAPVNIRANGALIGYGELVEIDGGLGVSIAALAERSA